MTTRRQIPKRGQKAEQSAPGKRNAVARTSQRQATVDLLDAQEADRRLDDPANAERIPWEQINAELGLWPVTSQHSAEFVPPGAHLR